MEKDFISAIQMQAAPVVVVKVLRFKTDSGEIFIVLI
jgi:hypothetical protein